MIGQYVFISLCFLFEQSYSQYLIPLSDLTSSKPRSFPINNALVYVSATVDDPNYLQLISVTLSGGPNTMTQTAGAISQMYFNVLPTTNSSLKLPFTGVSNTVTITSNLTSSQSIALKGYIYIAPQMNNFYAYDVNKIAQDIVLPAASTVLFFNTYTPKVLMTDSNFPGMITNFAFPKGVSSRLQVYYGAPGQLDEGKQNVFDNNGDNSAYIFPITMNMPAYYLKVDQATNFSVYPFSSDTSYISASPMTGLWISNDWPSKDTYTLPSDILFTSNMTISVKANYDSFLDQFVLFKFQYGSNDYLTYNLTKTSENTVLNGVANRIQLIPSSLHTGCFAIQYFAKSNDNLPNTQGTILPLTISNPTQIPITTSRTPITTSNARGVQLISIFTLILSMCL